MEILTGSAAILKVGKELYKDRFNLDNPERRGMYERLFYSFTDNPKQAQFGMKPGKGNLIIGDIGVGKTMMMKTMQVLFRDTPRRFRWINCLAFKDMLEEGMKAIDIKAQYGRDLKCDLYIDDLGLGRADFNKFGNVTNIIAEIIFERDELFIDENFRTHFSSNVPTTVPKTEPPEVKSIERMYGDRALDRIKQMDNLIEWVGKSMRGL